MGHQILGYPHILRKLRLILAIKGKISDFKYFLRFIMQPFQGSREVLIISLPNNPAPKVSAPARSADIYDIRRTI